MDTMIKAVRVALLLVVTSTFVGIWSCDHPDRMADVDCPGKVLVGCRSEELLPKDFPSANRSEDLSEIDPTMPSASEVSLSIPLPEGISVGTYVIVDQSGHTGIRTVTEEDTLSLGHLEGIPVSTHYTVMHGNIRWHYIRIESSASDRITAASMTSSIQ